MDTHYGIISMTWSERKLPRFTLDNLEVTEIIQTSPGVAAGTDVLAMYNRRRPISPKLIPHFSASVPNMYQRTAIGQFTVELMVLSTTRHPTDVDIPALFRVRVKDAHVADQRGSQT